MLKKALNPEAAAEFLTFSFHPAKLISTLQSDPETVLCDPVLFNQTFSFTEGVDIVTIQSQLCAATRGNNSLVMEDLWKMFDLKKLASEIGRLTGVGAPDANKPLTESPFRTILKQFQRLLQNANVITRLMQAFNNDLPNVADYISLLLSTVNTYLQPDANSVGGMCDAVVNLIDEVPEFDMARPYLVNIQLINSIIAQVATSLDHVDEFMCELPSLNMSTLLYRVANSDLIELSDQLMLVNNMEYLKSAKFQCSQLVQDIIVPQEKIQHLITDALMPNGSMQTCFRKLVSENITILNDVNSVLGLLGGLRDLLMSDQLNNLVWLDGVRPLLNEVISGLLGEVTSHTLSTAFCKPANQSILLTKLCNVL